MQRFRVECNFGSKYFDDIFNARRYFYILTDIVKNIGEF